MVTTSCASCGTQHQFDDALIPPSGIVMKCSACGKSLTVMPPATTSGHVTLIGNLAAMGPPPPAAPATGRIGIVPGPAVSAFDGDESDLLVPEARPGDMLGLGSPRRLGLGAPGESDAPDLLAPVGPASLRGDLPRPAVTLPDEGADVLAPKGFFDDLPAGRRLAAPPPGQAGVLPTLDLDELADFDIVPATGVDPSPLASAEPMTLPLLDLPDSFLPPDTKPLDLGELPMGGPVPGPGPAASAAPEIDLLAPPSSAGAAPSKPGDDLLPAPRPVAGLPSDAGAGGVDLLAGLAATPIAATMDPPAAEAGAGEPQDALQVAAVPRRAGTLAGQSPGRGGSAAAARAMKKAKQVSRRQRAVGAGVALVLLVAGGFLFYTRYEFSFLGLATKPVRDRERTLSRRLADARKAMASDDAGHWAAALEAADTVVDLNPMHPDALGIITQGHLAIAIDEGADIRSRMQQADRLLASLARRHLKGPEIDKAQALRDAVQGKCQPATALLANVARRLPRDTEVPLYQGWAALACKDSAAAKAAFESALKKRPDRLPALYGLGRALLAAGDAPGARPLFEKVLAKRPAQKHFGAMLGLAEMLPADRAGTRERELGALCERSPEREGAHPRDLARAWLLYGEEAQAAGNVDQAAERYRRASELDPANLDAQVGLGTTSLAVGKKEEALLRLDNVLAQDPAHVRAQVVRAQVTLALGKLDDAIKAIDAAVALAPKDAAVHLWAGRVKLANALSNDAAAAFRKAIELAPEDYTAYVELAQVLIRSGKPEYNEQAIEVIAPVAKAANSDAALANSLGMAYLGVNNPGVAEQWMRRALELNPGGHAMRATLGSAIEAQGRLDEALVEYAAAHAAEPSNEDFALRHARGLERAGRTDEAATAYGALVSTDGGRKPSNTAAAAAGRFFAKIGDAARARAMGEQILSSDPSYPAGLFLRGFGQMAEGKLVEAAKNITDALLVDPAPQYYEALGRVNERQNALVEAMEAFGKAAQADPSYAAPRLGRARVRMVRREFSAAIGELSEAAKLDPKNANIWADIGRCHLELGKAREATAAIKEALRRNAQDGGLHFLLGKALALGEKAADAIANLERAVKLGPETADWIPEANRTLGFLYRDRGQKAAMCAAFRRYLPRADRDPMLEEARRASLSCP